MRIIPDCLQKEIFTQLRRLGDPNFKFEYLLDVENILNNNV